MQFNTVKIIITGLIKKEIRFHAKPLDNFIKTALRHTFSPHRLFFFLRPTYLPSSHVLKYLQTMFFQSMRDPYFDRNYR